MPEGEEPSEKPQSGEDEEFYTVRLTIYPKPVLGLQDPFAGTHRQREGAALYEDFWKNHDYLERAFKEAAEKVEYSPTVKFTLRKLHILPRGSFTLLAILGAVYVGVKDYEVVRRSLLAIAKDMRDIVEGLFPPELRGLWAIDSEVRVEGTSPILLPAGASGETPTLTPTPAEQGSSQSLPQRGSNWAARHAFILYLAITNVVLIVFLGLLLMRAAS